MLRKILDYQVSLTEKGKPLHAIRPLITAGDTFFYEPAINTSRGPHVRDAVDLKRWMIIVVFALIPAILVAIWNTGLQKIIYSSGSYPLMNDFLIASTSWDGYWEFAMQDNRWLMVLKEGALAFIPVMIISYAVGGICEGIFACVRGHEIAEGFLVTGMLYPLVLPPTIPYWMVAVGVAAGVIISKELFGGTGMNILNPALTCRAFLFFTFPNRMSGDIWVGTNTTAVKQSLSQASQQASAAGVDGISQMTPLSMYNISDDIKRVHVDAIASNSIGSDATMSDTVNSHLQEWNGMTDGNLSMGSMDPVQLKEFVTGAPELGGLGLGAENYDAAISFAKVNYGVGHYSDWNHFLGNQLGCFGETSTLACLLGAVILIWTGIGSWRTMVSCGIAAYLTALLFNLGADWIGSDAAWNSAKYAFPAYKHLILGGLMFGLVFMTTDPVSAANTNRGRWIYGALVGFVVILIRAINPAYPEGMMLAILFGNVCAPLIDHSALRSYRRIRRVATA